ncbi:MAG: NAD-dependent epimerase/dehydratase family protein [Brachybacterium alimentarium]|uniref:NAD-dependent epimerase/dehydratase family protein n=1 Tax=Brachybacterium alimentarium TaxID=47845 RepID=UPI000DF11938|nr:NAD-dependent epimerase/dehydratase family protein [Brachybacterium alimentarium]RCS76148.1 NAD-dependent epimerase/dehydratase family protein [Brachybacterium alimentarium]RCS85694.1 NAD-dependent epimerase/dehydratase family protein [Brachybacterium alimentarium]
MHHLVIGEGQIGRAIIDRALADGDTVTVLRRSEIAPSPGIHRVAGDVLDPAAIEAAVTGADAIHACFHAAYDARIWRRDLPPRELAVLEAAAAHDVPVVFPESMYAFQGRAADLAEGAEPAPLDAKGEVRLLLLEQRRRHPARTLSLIASDLVGPTAVGTGASVASAMIIERIAAGQRPIVVGDPAAAHTLTHIPDLARAMLHGARHAARLAPNGDAVLNAPSAPARSQRELIAHASSLLGRPARRPVRVPLVALRALSGVNTFARELSGISRLWYAPCVLRPGILTTVDGLEPTSWPDAVRASADKAASIRAGADAAPVSTSSPLSS